MTDIPQTATTGREAAANAAADAADAVDTTRPAQRLSPAEIDARFAALVAEHRGGKRSKARRPGIGARTPLHRAPRATRP